MTMWFIGTQNGLRRAVREDHIVMVIADDTIDLFDSDSDEALANFDMHHPVRCVNSAEMLRFLQGHDSPHLPDEDA